MSDTQVDKNDAANTGGDGQKANPDTKTLSFSEEQVGWINKHSDEMFGKGMNKAKAEWEPKLSDATTKLTEAATRITELETQLNELKASQADAGNKKKTEEPTEDVKKLTAKLAELQSNLDGLLNENKQAKEALDTERTRNREARIKDEFMTAATSLNFFDANDVFQLVKGDIAFDDKHGVVIRNHETGEPRMTISGGLHRPVTLAEHLAEFASKKPQYVRAANTDGGSGAGGSRKLQAGSDLPDFNGMTPQQIAEYANSVKSRR